MSKKKLLLLCIGLILLVIVISQFVAVSLSGFTNVGGGCISVVFDKHFVCGADRIVVYEGDQVITITEKSTVRRIASEFIVSMWSSPHRATVHRTVAFRYSSPFFPS